jgi:hypothetical protein
VTKRITVELLGGPCDGLTLHDITPATHLDVPILGTRTTARYTPVPGRPDRYQIQHTQHTTEGQP